MSGPRPNQSKKFPLSAPGSPTLAQIWQHDAPRALRRAANAKVEEAEEVARAQTNRAEAFSKQIVALQCELKAKEEKFHAQLTQRDELLTNHQATIDVLRFKIQERAAHVERVENAYLMLRAENVRLRQQLDSMGKPWAQLQRAIADSKRVQLPDNRINVSGVDKRSSLGGLGLGVNSSDSNSSSAYSSSSGSSSRGSIESGRSHSSSDDTTTSSDSGHEGECSELRNQLEAVISTALGS